MEEAWQNIQKATLINLVDSMKRRRELILEDNGKRIPY